METIDLSLTKEELIFLQECISAKLIFYSEVPESAARLIELIQYKLEFLNKLDVLEKEGQTWP